MVRRSFQADYIYMKVDGGLIQLFVLQMCGLSSISALTKYVILLVQY